MRRLVLAALAALVLAGAALADPLDPKVSYNARDQKLARAALLVQTDLGPGWQGGALKEPSSLKQPICPQLRPNFSKLTITGHAESVFDNGNGGVQVSSDVEVWKNEKQAARHMNALLKPALPTCIRYSLLKTVGGVEQAVLLKTEKHDLGKLAADTAVSYRVPVGYKVGKQTVVVASDFLLVRKGRTELYVNVTGPSDDPALLALEKRIAKALVARIRS